MQEIERKTPPEPDKVMWSNPVQKKYFEVSAIIWEGCGVREKMLKIKALQR